MWLLDTHARWGEPHHMRSTVKSVFLLACFDTSSLIWLKDTKVLTKITSSLNGVLLLINQYIIQVLTTTTTYE